MYPLWGVVKKKRTMKTLKRRYDIPQIKKIELDNEIAMQLESTPPYAPGETFNLKSPDCLKIDPFKLNQV